MFKKQGFIFKARKKKSNFAPNFLCDLEQFAFLWI